jgi:hypothetical protein
MCGCASATVHTEYGISRVANQSSQSCTHRPLLRCPNHRAHPPALTMQHFRMGTTKNTTTSSCLLVGFKLSLVVASARLSRERRAALALTAALRQQRLLTLPAATAHAANSNCHPGFCHPARLCNEEELCTHRAHLLP